MMSIKENNIKQIELVCVDDLVAKDHLVRKIQKAILVLFMILSENIIVKMKGDQVLIQ